jgi:membrane-bound lytic murein transglycosylase A
MQNPTNSRLLHGALLALLLTGCAAEPLAPDYGRPLPPGSPALLPLGPDEPWPDIAADWEHREELVAALDRSIDWTRRPSAQGFFPIEGVDHVRALASLERFRELLLQSPSADEFERRMQREFTAYKSAGWDGRGGGVLFTGYCTPILDGSREPSDSYRYPLYALPPDLVKDPAGNILGQRQPDGSVRPYPARGEIDGGGLLAGQGLELVWMKDPFDAYVAHVNGSAVIRLVDGGMLRLGYAGNNGHEYTSVRTALIEDRQLTEAEANLPAMRRWAAENPDRAEGYIARNGRYVFFTPIEGNPRGSLNVEVSANRTLATDKRLFPRGAVVFVDTRLATGRGRAGRPFHQFMLDQDTGGAIRTAGRADIYLGVGPTAERLAGTTQAEGQLYYFFLKG